MWSTTSTRGPRAGPASAASSPRWDRMARCYREQLRDVVVMASPDGTRAAAEYVVHGDYLRADDGLPPAQQASTTAARRCVLRYPRRRHRARDQLLQPRDWLARVRDRSSCMPCLLRSRAWIALLACVLALADLGLRGIWGSRRRALHQRRAEHAGQWRLAEPAPQPRSRALDKPPLTHWAIASSVGVLGHSLPAARLPSARLPAGGRSGARAPRAGSRPASASPRWPTRRCCCRCGPAVDHHRSLPRRMPGAGVHGSSRRASAIARARRWLALMWARSAWRS